MLLVFYLILHANMFLVSSQWSKSSGKSSPSNATVQPLGRRGHTAVVYKNVMTIFGGYQDLKGSTSELWTFHLGNTIKKNY